MGLHLPALTVRLPDTSERLKRALSASVPSKKLTLWLTLLQLAGFVAVIALLSQLFRIVGIDAGLCR